MAEAARKRIIARPAIKRVVTGLASDRVVETIPRAAESPRYAAKSQILDIGDCGNRICV